MLNKYIKSIISVTLSAVMLSSSVTAIFESNSPEKNENTASYEGYIVKFRDTVSASLLSAEEDVFSLDDEKFAVVESLDEAKKFPEDSIEYIEPNYVAELLEQETGTSMPDKPTDPYYEEQWNMISLGAYYAYKQGLTGDGIKVGFIDSGLNPNHEDVNAEKLHGNDFANYIDQKGHGTFTSGILAAQVNNGKGVIGMAPNSEIYMYKVFDGKTADVSDICKAIEKASDDGCNIINMSFGLERESSSLKEAIEKAQNKGIIIVAAVGNSGRKNNDIMYPAGYDGVIGVGSIAKDYKVSDFSQKNNTVDFVAPGEGVMGLGCENPDSYTGTAASGVTKKGTSYAAPVVAGMAALAYEYYPQIKLETILQLLKLSSKDLGIKGRDNFYGYGAVNVEEFIKLLTRDYNISYNLSGGKLDKTAVNQYNIKDGDIELPIPQKNGCEFLGWYLDEAYTENISSISSTSVGDIELYAKWDGTQITEISSISIGQQKAKQNINGEFTVELSHKCDISKINTDEITVSLSNPDKAEIKDVRKDENDENRIIITVAAKDESVSEEFILNLMHCPIYIKDGFESINGEAEPPSLDGETKAKPYIAEDIYSWFSYENGTLPKDFSVKAELKEGKGELSLNGQTLTYTPVPEDAETNVKIEVYGETSGVLVPDSVKITVEIVENPSIDKEIIENSDGSVTTILRDKEKGIVSKTREFKDGCVATSDKRDGFTNINIQLTKQFAKDAKQSNAGVVLPMTDDITASGKGASTHKITINTENESGLKIIVPVKNPTSGTVAMRIKAKGTRDVIKDSIMTERGLGLEVNDGMTIEIVNNAMSFQDVLPRRWYKDAIDYATARELLNGLDEVSFGPNNNTTRCMIVTVLYRFENEPKVNGNNEFYDVPYNEWYTDAITWAAENNIVNGYGDGLFVPNDFITRQQMAAILYRYAKYKGYDLTIDKDLNCFKDKNTINDYAIKAMSWTYSKGLITGMSDTSIEPNGKASRAQIATILMRMIKGFENPLIG